MAAVLMAAGCGTNGTATGESLSDGGRPAATPEADVPPGSDPEAVAPHLRELLLAYDRVTDQVVADPDVARDPDDPLIDEFLGLFEDDSEHAATMVTLWEERADDGLQTLPYSDDYPAGESLIDGPLETVSDDEVVFPLCVISRAQVLGPDGEEAVPTLPRLDRPGEGVAIRTDQGWRLREMEVWTDRITCRDDEE